MAEEKRKVQLEVGVAADTSGLDQIAQAAQEMAQGVQQAGAQAKLGLDAISNAAEPAAEKIDQATSRMAASIQRATAALQTGAKGSADYYQSLAAARGIDVAPLEAYIAELRRVEAAQKSLQQANAQAARADSFIASIKAQAEAAGKSRSELLALQAAQLGLSQQAAPYVQRLKETEQALLAGAHGAGEFGFQTAAAKRELLVLTHELATGNVKNFGTSMLVLGERTGAASLLFSSTALTAAALVGAVVAVGVAAAKGASELKAFQEATTLTGNAIGLSASGFTQLRDSLVGIAGTRGKAAEALTEIAQNGKIAGTSVQGIAEAAILMERATGQAISKTVEQFAELAKSPAEASAKLNTQYHYLTAAVYEQIKALEDQGKATQAAKLAEDTYAAALKDRAETVIGSAGTMQRAWTSVTEVAKKAWDAMLGIGRQTSNAEQVAAAAANLARAQAEVAAANAPDPGRGASIGMGVPGILSSTNAGRQAAAQQRLANAQAELAAAQQRLQLEQNTTQAKAEQNRLEQLAIGFHQDEDKYLSKRQEEERALTKARVEGQELVKAGLITQADLEKRLNDIRTKFNQSGAAGTGQNEVADIQARINSQRQLLARLQAQLATGNFSESVQLTPGELQVNKLTQELQTNIRGVARAEKERALALAQSEVAIDKEVVSQERQNKAYQEAVATQKKQADAASQQAEAIEQQARGQEAANATYGKSKTAIEEMVLAQLRLQAAEADASDTFDPRYVAGLNAKVAAQTRYVAALQESANKQAVLSNTNLANANQRDADLLQLEMTLTGRTQEERTRIVEQRRIELEYAQKIADVDKLGLTPADAAARKAELATQRTVAASTAAAKSTLGEWQRTADSIDSSLAEAGVSAFHKISDAASIARDEIKSLFDSLVLQPVLKAVFAPVAGVLASAGTGLAQSIIGGGARVAGGGLGSSLAGVGGSLLAGMSLGNASGTLFANATGTGLDGLLAATGAYGTAAGAGAAAAGGTGLLGAASAGLSAIGPVGWAGLAALAAYTIFGGKGGGPKTESGAGIGVRTTGDVAGVAAQMQGIQQQYSDLATALGARAGQVGRLDLGIFSSQDPKGTALTQLQVNALLNGQSIYSRDARLGHDNIENVGRSPEELQAAMTEESKRVVLEALQATNLPGQVGGYLRQLGDLNTLTSGDLDKALTRAQTIGTQRAQLEDQLSQMVETSEQRLIRTRQAEKDATDELNQSLLDQVHNMQDLQDALNTSMTGVQAAVDAERTQVSDSLNALMQQLDANVKSAMNVVQASVDAERNRAQASFDATMKALQVQIDAATGTVSRLTDISGTLHGARDTFTVDAQTGMQHDEAAAAVQAAIAIAKAQGTLPDTNALQAPLDVLTRSSTDPYSSLVEFTRARDKDAAAIQDLADLSDQGLTAAQQQLQATQAAAQATQDAFDVNNSRLDSILATAKDQVDAAQGTTVAVMDANTALGQLLDATSAYAGQYGAAQAQLAAENARLDGVLAAAQAQVAAAMGTTVAVTSVETAVSNFSSALLSYLSARDAARSSLTTVPTASSAAATIMTTDPRLMTVLNPSNFDSAAYLAANPDVAQFIASHPPGSAGYTTAYTHFQLFGHNEARPLGFVPQGFASGAAFTNGVVTRPTAFNIGQMGEQYSEAIMPLANIGGSLGVRAMSPLNDEMRDLLIDANTMLRAIAQHAFKSAKNTGDMVDRGVTVKTDSDTPLQVQTV